LADPPATLPTFDDIPDPLSAAAPRVELPPAQTPARPAPTRGDVARARRLALLVGSGWVVGQLAIAGIRADMVQVPLGYTLGLGVLPFAAGALCFAAALAPGRLGLGARVVGLALLALIAPLIFTVSNYVFSPPYAGAPLGEFKHGVFCFNIAMAWTLLPLVVAGFALRSTFVAGAVWRSALLGLGAGLVVATTSMLRCPLSGAWHMALSHGGAVVASALLGAFVLSRVTRA
jgi:hypothetical protein